MPTALADPPAAPTEQQPPAGAPAGPEQAAPAAGPQSPVRPCAKCGASLLDGQDWCLQCGTGVPDSLRARTPTWRSAAVVLATLGILVAGAAGAAYAALSKGSGKAAPAATTVAQAPAPTTAATIPSTTPPPVTTPATPLPKIGVPTTIKPSTPPKIPLASPTPTPIPPAVTPPSGAGGSSPTGKQKALDPNTPVGEANAEALLLDTNAASTYNPYNYAASNFGDPSLAIDGDSSTGWTALVEPSVAPKMAEGLVIDLITPRKLAAVGLSTTTPGMTVQVYGADGQAPPTSIVDPAWVALTPALQAKKKHARIKLGASGATQAAGKKAHRFIVLWISQAPVSAVGTPEAPGRVSVNELELFPAKKN